MTKLLLVSHEASRTGAPRMAVEILEASRSLFDVRVAVARWPGPLCGDLAAAADRFQLEPLRWMRVLLRRSRRTRHLAVRLEQAAARIVIRRERPDVVYLNTVLSACYVRPALALGCRVILHSHEMDELLSGTLARYELKPYFERIQMVACSRPAAEQLSAVTGIGAVTVIPEVIDVNRIQRLATESRTPSDSPAMGKGGPTRDELTRPTVVACGTADHRKGTDLWLKMAREIHRRLGAMTPTFIWIGQPADPSYEQMAKDLGLGGCVRFTGPLANPFSLLASATVMTVPSRQDAFPLVVLEGMALRRPMVAFDVGGIADQLGDAGVLVSPEDVPGMAGSVISLLENEETRRKLGAAAIERVERMYGLDRLREGLTLSYSGLGFRPPGSERATPPPVTVGPEDEHVDSRTSPWNAKPESGCPG